MTTATDDKPETDEKATSAFDEITHVKKRAFLTAFVETASILHASQATEISRQNHSLWMRKDQQYAAAFARAQDMAADTLESVAIQRAVKGWEEVTTRTVEGVEVEQKRVTKMSNALLIFMLKAMRPDKYRERYQIDHAGGEEVMGKVAALVARHLTPAQHSRFQDDLCAMLEGSGHRRADGGGNGNSNPR